MCNSVLTRMALLYSVCKKRKFVHKTKYLFTVVFNTWMVVEDLTFYQ